MQQQMIAHPRSRNCPLYLFAVNEYPSAFQLQISASVSIEFGRKFSENRNVPPFYSRLRKIREWNTAEAMQMGLPENICAQNICIDEYTIRTLKIFISPVVPKELSVLTLSFSIAIFLMFRLRAHREQHSH